MHATRYVRETMSGVQRCRNVYVALIIIPWAYFAVARGDTHWRERERKGHAAKSTGENDDEGRGTVRN